MFAVTINLDVLAAADHIKVSNVYTDLPKPENNSYF